MALKYVLSHLVYQICFKSRIFNGFTAKWFIKTNFNIRLQCIYSVSQTNLLTDLVLSEHLNPLDTVKLCLGPVNTQETP